MSLAPLPLSSKVTVLRGLGPARAAALQEAGIDTLRDLLWSLPYRYVDRGSLRPLGSLDMRGFETPDSDIVTVLGTIQDLRQSTTRVQRMALTELLLTDDTGTLRLLWFNQPYLGRTLKVGDRLLVFGPLFMGRHGLEMRGPQFEVMERSGDIGWVRRYLPLYRRLGPLTGRVRQKLVIYSTGKVTGRVRYGKLVVEEGGQLSGEIDFGTSAPARAASGTRPGLQVHTAAA